jgi:hypothetical protein
MANRRVRQRNENETIAALRREDIALRREDIENMMHPHSVADAEKVREAEIIDLFEIRKRPEKPRAPRGGGGSSSAFPRSRAA